jgi:hypothetical protein
LASTSPVGTYQIPVSPKNVVVAGRLAVSDAEGASGVWVEFGVGVWARAAVDAHASTAASVIDLRTVVIKAVPPAVPAKKQLGRNSTAELYSKSINDLRGI